MTDIPRAPGRLPPRGGANRGGAAFPGRGVGVAGSNSPVAASSPGVRKFPPVMAPPSAPSAENSNLPPSPQSGSPLPRPVSVMKQRPPTGGASQMRPTSYMPKSAGIEALGLETATKLSEMHKRPSPPSATRSVSTMLPRSADMDALSLESSTSKFSGKVQKIYSSPTVGEGCRPEPPVLPPAKGRPIPPSTLKVPLKKGASSTILTHARNGSEGATLGRSISMKTTMDLATYNDTPAIRPTSGMKMHQVPVMGMGSAPIIPTASVSEIITSDVDFDDDIKDQASTKKGLFSTTKFMDSLKKVSSDITSSGSAAFKTLQKSIASPRPNELSPDGISEAVEVPSVELPGESHKKKELASSGNFRKSVLSALNPNQFKFSEKEPKTIAEVMAASPQVTPNSTRASVMPGGSPQLSPTPRASMAPGGGSPQVSNPSPRASLAPGGSPQVSHPTPRASMAPGGSPQVSQSLSRSNSTGVSNPTPRAPPVNPNEPEVDKRTKIVRELLATEKTYVGQLEAMIEVYMKPLMQMAETPPDATQNRPERYSVKGLNLNSILGSKGMKITPEDIKTMFSNVEQLLPINRELLTQIEARLKNWHDKQKIGDIFNKMAPFFKMYNSYGNNYEKAVELYSKCEREPIFLEVLRQCDAEAERIGSIRLASLLITPVQRIPRYNLLLSDILRKTETNHPDFDNLKSALSSLEEVASYLDNDIKAAENTKRLLELSTKGAMNLLASHRKLLREGLFNVENRKVINKITKQRLRIWLFNDMLVHLSELQSKNKHNLEHHKHHWPLSLVWLKEWDKEDLEKRQPGEKERFGFHLVGPTKSYSVWFKTQGEKSEWMDAIREATDVFLKDKGGKSSDINRYGTYQYLDGSEYVGNWKFGKMHGDGTISFYGNRYQGEWESNLKSGKGVLSYASGESYNGQWVNNLPNGIGTTVYSNGDRYTGDWVDGRRQGHGEIHYENGDHFDGSWVADLPQGPGKLTFASGLIYVGDFYEGELHGIGKLVHPNGRVYDGDWVNGTKTGKGFLDYTNGTTYDGEWLDDRRHGTGTYTSPTEQYAGEWMNDDYEGQGCLKYLNGSKYEGQFKKGKFSGIGTLTWPHGPLVKYEGEWVLGKFDGKGVLHYRNGCIYSGSFRRGKIQGHGVLTSTCLSKIDGRWQSGSLNGKASFFSSTSDGKLSGECNNNLITAPKQAAFEVAPCLPLFSIPDL